MKRFLTIALVLAATVSWSEAKGLPAIKLTDEWKAQIEKIAPEEPAAKVNKKPTALIFSVMTGYKHWVTPHTTEMLRILGEKSGAYDVVVSDDVKNFEPDNIKKFDIIILNNNCSDRKKRDMFWDITKDEARARALENSLIDHIAGGAGLVSIHGAITMQNNSKEFSSMCGGSFDRHPPQQKVICNLVDPDHPIVKPFDGKAYVHVDEPYLFKSAYNDMNFRPLMEMDVSSLKGYKHNGVKRYAAWIKRHEKGRVFYCSPSHNAQSFEDPELLQFILNGIQYAAGDLDCDDSPIKK